MSDTLEGVPCPLCGSERATPVLEGRDMLLGGPGIFVVASCGACAHRFQSPRPTREAIAAHYPQRYYEPYTQGGRLAEGLRRRLDTYRARSLARSLPRGGSVLEVGCSTGDFLAQLRDHGLRVEGIELSPDAAETARERYGLDVRSGMIEELPLDEGHYDLILLRQVLEHLFDPVRVCRKLAAALRPGGSLHCSLPNVGSFEARLFGRYWHGLDLPRHLQHFTPATVERLFAAADLRLDRVGYSPVPNDWVRSLGYLVVGPVPGSFFSLGNPLLLALCTLPALLTAALESGGRMVCVGRKPTIRCFTP